MKRKARFIARIFISNDTVEFYEGTSRIPFDCDGRRCTKRVEVGDPAIKTVRHYADKSYVGKNWFCRKCGQAEFERFKREGLDWV